MAAVPVFFFANDAQARITVSGLCEVRGTIEHAIIAASPEMLHLARRLPKQLDNTMLSVRACRQDSRSDFAQDITRLAKTRERLQVLPIGNMPTRWCLEIEEKLSQEGIRVGFGDLDSHRRLDSKLEAQRLAVESGFEPVNQRPVPPQRSDLPFVVKPIDPEDVDAEFRRPILVRTEEEFYDLERSGIDWTRMYAEEYLSGRSLYLCCYLEHGVIREAYVQRNLWQAQAGGSVISAEIVDLSQPLFSLGEAFFSRTNWTGPAMIEVRECAGGIRFIECNPRFWGPIDLGSRNGYVYFRRQIGVQSSSRAPRNSYRYFNISLASNAVAFRLIRGQRYTLLARDWRMWMTGSRDPLVRWGFVRLFLLTLIKPIRRKVTLSVQRLGRMPKETH